MTLDFDGLFNARDLGGLPTADGRRVKEGLLLRSARLDELSDRDVRQLAALPLRHIFDFRDLREMQQRPDRSVPGAELHALPVLPGLPGQNNGDYLRQEPEQVLALLERMYVIMATHEKSAAAYRAFFRTLLEHPGDAVLWHCTQGKDRTGIAALLLLTALGVDETAAVDEYFLTNLPMLGKLDEHRLLGMTARELAVMEKLLLVHHRCLDAYRESIRARWGGLMGYLREVIGLTDADLSLLRSAYTE